MKKILTIEIYTEHEIEIGKRYSFLPIARMGSKIPCLVTGVKTLYDEDAIIEHRLDNFVERHFDHETRIKDIEADIKAMQDEEVKPAEEVKSMLSDEEKIELEALRARLAHRRKSPNSNCVGPVVRNTCCKQSSNEPSGPK